MDATNLQALIHELRSRPEIWASFLLGLALRVEELEQGDHNRIVALAQNADRIEARLDALARKLAETQEGNTNWQLAGHDKLVRLEQRINASESRLEAHHRRLNDLESFHN